MIKSKQIELSKRLQAAADLVSEGNVFADIGTDHGYIPIYLVSSGKNPCGFAMDVNKGPLERADFHISEYGLEEKIQTRLSDGLKALRPGEAESAVIAGMGGQLIIRILSDSLNVAHELKECILQPQSEIAKVRRFLFENGFRITDENMVLEDGKFYPMMRVVTAEPEAYTDSEYRYGKKLLEVAHPVLKQFLDRELGSCENILRQMEGKESAAAIAGRLQLQKKKEEITDVMQRYFK